MDSKARALLSSLLPPSIKKPLRSVRSAVRREIARRLPSEQARERFLGEEDQDAEVDESALRGFAGRHRGERCFIIGNGPSLNQTDLARLSGDVTFAVNGIFYKTDETGFQPTYYVVEDRHVARDNRERINAYRGPRKFFPATYRRWLDGGESVVCFRMNRGFCEPASPHYGVPRFSTDCSQRIFCGQSVTFINLQLAYYMGFQTVYLVGIDFSYVIPRTAVVDGVDILSTADDPNHFHKDYFGKGKRWHDPQLERVRLSLEKARAMFEADGRKIFNATKGGKLEVFDRADYDALF